MADSKKTTVSRPKIRIGKKTNIAIETVPVVPATPVPATPVPAPATPVPATPVPAEPVPAEAVVPATIKKTTVKPSAKQSAAEPSVAAPSVAETRRGEPSRRPDTAKKHGERDLHELYNLYLQNVTKVSPDEELELEVKFGTLGVKSITRINYDTIMKKLLSSGFYVDSTVYLLRIQNEYMEPRTGAPRLSNLRTEISGLQNIRKYCQSNTLDAIDTGISYIDKSRFKTDKPTSVDVLDYNFRVSLSKEIRLDKNAQLVRGSIYSF